MHRTLDMYGGSRLELYDVYWMPWNVTRDWMHTAKPWTTSASHDRDYWNRQQPPHFSSPLYKDEPLTPTMLLMMNTCPLAPHPGNLDLYACNWWKRARYLADQFWVRCKREYLQNFQNRSKWRSGGTLMAKCWWPKWLHVEQETQIPTKKPISSFVVQLKREEEAWFMDNLIPWSWLT